MAEITDRPETVIPPGIRNTALDTTLLVARLRELYRNLRFKADTAQSDEERQLCHCLMQELEQIIAGHKRQRSDWETIRDDLVREIVSAVKA